MLKFRLLHLLVSLSIRVCDWFHPVTDVPGFPYKKILVIKFCCLGDTIMLTPMLQALKQKYPHAQLDVLIGTYSAPILDHFPGIAIVPARFLNKRGIDKILSFIRLIRQLKKNAYDVAINTHRSPLIFFLQRLTRAKSRIGFDWHETGLGLTKKVPFDARAHESQRYLTLSQAIGARFDYRHYRIYLSKKEQAAAAGLAANKISVALAPGGGINPYTKMPLKRWSLSAWQACSNALPHEKLNFLFLGAPSERHLIDPLADEFPGMRGYEYSLREQLALLKQCNLLITGDTVFMHAGAALDIPVIALFGPTDPALLAPQKDNVTVLTGTAPCRPCNTPDIVFSKKYKSCTNNQCMQSIASQIVAQTARTLLTKKELL